MAAFDIVVWWVGIAGWLPIALCLGAIGIVTFLGVLILTQRWLESKRKTREATVEEGFDKNTIQLAITASVLAMYFALAPLLIFGGASLADPTLSNTIIGHFTTVVEVVVAFYMGTATLGYTAKMWGISKAPPEERAGLLRGM